jgi:hypothetical protein
MRSHHSSTAAFASDVAVTVAADVERVVLAEQHQVIHHSLICPHAGSVRSSHLRSYQQ